MPSITFLNLPESKKNNLINAALKEFSKMPLYKVSLNKIIKDSNISHGSFYTYFKDKEELYFYILSEHHKKINEKMKYYLNNNEGDVILMFKDMFNYIINLKNNSMNSLVLTNVFENMNFEIENFLFLKNKKEDTKEITDEIFSLINKNLLSISESEFDIAFKMLVTSMINSLIEVLVFKLDQNEITMNYYTKLNIIEQGIYKKKEGDIC